MNRIWCRLQVKNLGGSERIARWEMQRIGRQAARAMLVILRSSAPSDGPRFIVRAPAYQLACE
jgi:hypothetical protein